MNVGGSNSFNNIKYAKPKQGEAGVQAQNDEVDSDTKRSHVASMSSSSGRGSDTTISKAFDVLETTGRLPEHLHKQLVAWHTWPTTHDLFKINFLNRLYEYAVNTGRSRRDLSTMLNNSLDNQVTTLNFPSQKAATTAPVAMLA